MADAIFSLDHRMNELQQVGAELRSARQARKAREGQPFGLGTIVQALRETLAIDRGATRPTRLATH